MLYIILICYVLFCLFIFEIYHITGSEVKAKVGKGRRADQSGVGRERGKIPLAVDLGPLGMKLFQNIKGMDVNASCKTVNFDLNNQMNKKQKNSHLLL